MFFRNFHHYKQMTSVDSAADNIFNQTFGLSYVKIDSRVYHHHIIFLSLDSTTSIYIYIYMCVCASFDAQVWK